METRLNKICNRFRPIFLLDVENNISLRVRLCYIMYCGWESKSSHSPLAFPPEHNTLKPSNPSLALSLSLSFILNGHFWIVIYSLISIHSLIDWNLYSVLLYLLKNCPDQSLQTLHKPKVHFRVLISLLHSNCCSSPSPFLKLYTSGFLILPPHLVFFVLLWLLWLHLLWSLSFLC